MFFMRCGQRKLMMWKLFIMWTWVIRVWMKYENKGVRISCVKSSHYPVRGYYTGDDWKCAQMFCCSKFFWFYRNQQSAKVRMWPRRNTFIVIKVFNSWCHHLLSTLTSFSKTCWKFCAAACFLSDDVSHGFSVSCQHFGEAEQHQKLLGNSTLCLSHGPSHSARALPECRPPPSFFFLSVGSFVLYNSQCALPSNFPKSLHNGSIPINNLPSERSRSWQFTWHFVCFVFQQV